MRGKKKEEGELPVLATWIHVLVSRSIVKRGYRGSINMRMTRTVWFCALLDAHADKFVSVLDRHMLNTKKIKRWTVHLK